MKKTHIPDESGGAWYTASCMENRASHVRAAVEQCRMAWEVTRKFDPDQPRDDAGRFGEGGGGTSEPVATGVRGRVGALGRKAVSTLVNVARGAKLTAKDTVHAARTGIRALKGESISAADKARAVTALKDIGKAVLSAGIVAAPGGGIALAVVEKVAGKFGVSVIPSRFKGTKKMTKLDLPEVTDEDAISMLEEMLALLRVDEVRERVDVARKTRRGNR